MRLAVELYGVVVGTLEGDSRTFDFTPTPNGLERFGNNSSVLSVSIPLTQLPRRDHARRRRNWFNELLPEGDQLDYMLAQGGIHRGDSLGFLARYGRDVAGALQLWDMDDPTEPKIPSINPISSKEVRALLEDPINSPLANQRFAGKSSLGGVQPKIVLVKLDDEWAQALGGHPTTHILKPQLEGALRTTIFDEEYGARLARRLGLSTFSTTIEAFDSLPTLVVERYDRLHGKRIHQEDFSQILGASGNEKYQEVGGIVSLRRIANTLTQHVPGTSLNRLARMVILAVAVGNLDMHTKNISLLHPEHDDVTLAPAYDVVPQAHMNNDGKLALAVNKIYRHQDVTRSDLLAELNSWGLRRAASLVDETLEELASAVTHETPLGGAHPTIQDDIARFIQNLQDGKPMGLSSAG